VETRQRLVCGKTFDAGGNEKKNDIQPIQLDAATIRSFGGKASRMNGYHLDDVTKIALGMDSVIGIELKKQVFGQIGSFAKPETSTEVQWQKVLSSVFEGFDFPKQEKEREKLITQKYSLVRFHHFVRLETLFNGILQAKQGKTVRLYDLEQLRQEMPFKINPLKAQIA
jgi:hypothetical protein